MLFLYYLWHFLLISINGHCLDDEDLQRHKCLCNSMNSLIQCSSLPKHCYTCYRYNTLIFDEKVTKLKSETFRYYTFFNDANDISKNFQIQFKHLNQTDSNSFSNIHIPKNQVLEVKIFEYSSSILSSKLFEDLIVEPHGIFDIELSNVTTELLTIKHYAFDGMRLDRQSRFRMSIISSRNKVSFESNAGSLILSPYSYFEIYFKNFNRIVFNERCFDNLIQKESSQLKFNCDHFQSVSFLNKTFTNIQQYEQSRFDFSLTNLNSLLIKRTLFDNVKQFKSFLIFSIHNLTNDLCFPSKTFKNIKQNINATFALNITHARNILFTSDSFIDITQNLQSKLDVSISNSFDIYFSRYSLRDFAQLNHSYIDISIKYGQNLIFEDNAIHNITTHHSNAMNIDFQHSRGALQMGINAFSHVNNNDNGEINFHIMNSSDFYFRFNQSIKLKRLEIVDRLLSSNDLCRISNIPSHIPIKLLSDTPCSCTVYYLYRQLHRQLQPSILHSLAPKCYSNMSMNDIDNGESQCALNKKISDCQQMEGEIQINIPHGICEQDVNVYSNNQLKYSSSIFLIVALAVIFSFFLFNIICILTVYSSTSQSSLCKIISRFLPRKQSAHRTLIRYDTTSEQTENELSSNDFDLILSNKSKNIKLKTNPIDHIELN